MLIYKKSLRLQLVKNLQKDIGIATQGKLVLVVSLKVYRKRWGGLFVPESKELLFKLSVLQKDIERRNKNIREKGILLAEESNIGIRNDSNTERLL